MTHTQQENVTLRETKQGMEKLEEMTDKSLLSEENETQDPDESISLLALLEDEVFSLSRVRRKEFEQAQKQDKSLEEIREKGR